MAPASCTSSCTTRRCDCSRSLARSAMNWRSLRAYDSFISLTCWSSRCGASSALPPGPPTGSGASSAAGAAGAAPLPRVAPLALVRGVVEAAAPHESGIHVVGAHRSRGRLSIPGDQRARGPNTQRFRMVSSQRDCTLSVKPPV
eukprot:scaffold60851_cov57-Phaeocystis_antarctica.AAC.2